MVLDNSLKIIRKVLKYIIGEGGGELIVNVLKW